MPLSAAVLAATLAAVPLSAALADGAPPPTPAAPGIQAGSAAPEADLPTLRVADLVETGPAGLGPSARARAVAGKRIRLLGYMVHLEEPQAGALWLASHPVDCDEGGAGTGDLPPGAVLVLLPAGRASPGHLEGPLAVTGQLQVGNEADAAGRVSAFRILLDLTGPPAPAPHLASPGLAVPAPHPTP